MDKIFEAIKLFLNDRFNLGRDQEDNLETIRSIEKGVEFRGVNVWTLIFAIFVASIGLNVNSTAVIIGAMLISPLMGPIMGLGLSVGIYDFVLFKKSLKNLLIAVVISVLTSATYFFISPLNEAQSELLARTTPTSYDVLIALFGGLAGIVAGATKEKGNVIPGVAIATALMPPLCTAGFGIGTGNMYYFIGAFYLFFINAVMISLSTFLIVRFLKFPLKQQVDKKQALNVKKYIYIIVLITVLPSIYFAYQIVQQTIFKTNALKFITNEINFENTQIISKNITYNLFDSSMVELLIVGDRIEEVSLKKVENKMSDYDLKRTKLIVKQGIASSAIKDLTKIKSEIADEIFRKNVGILESQIDKIKLLESEVKEYKLQQYPIEELANEVNAINSKIKLFSANNIAYFDLRTSSIDTLLTVTLKSEPVLNTKELNMVHKWLTKRLKNEDIKIIVEK